MVDRQTIVWIIQYLDPGLDVMTTMPVRRNLQGTAPPLDDAAPGFGRSLPADLLVPSGQPARKKLIFIQCEVVYSQTQRRGSGASLRGRWLVAIVHDSCREVAKL